MRHRLLLLSTVLIALAAVPTVTAAPPAREIIPYQPDHTVLDQCAFPVLWHIDGTEIDTTFFDRSGNVVKLHGTFPGNTLTLTNLETGRSLTLGATGAYHQQINHDGSGSAMVTGHGAWHDGNPLTGEAGIWYQTGRVSTTWDAAGNTTSLTNSGSLVNLCSELAS